MKIKVLRWTIETIMWIEVVHRELSWVYHVESSLGKSKMGLELSSCKGFRPGNEGRPYVPFILRSYIPVRTLRNRN